MTPPDKQIDPQQVTKPIQLLAAWLVGLIAIDGTFLASASLITKPDWGAGLLVIAAVANVPIFLLALFLLQTRFRPEMQEDSFYARHLERKYSDQAQKMTVFEAPRPLPLAGQRKSRFSFQTSPARSPYVLINDLLPRYIEILNALAAAGVRPGDTFGSTSTVAKPPANFVVSVGTGTPHILAQGILEVVKDYGLDGVGVGWDESDRDQILIGAYTYEGDNSYLPTNSKDFARLLDEKADSKQFFSILSRYVRGPSDE